MSSFALPEPWSDHESQTLRLWLSDQQWMSLLSRIEQHRLAGPLPEGTRRRDPRVAASFLCALRLQQRDGKSATFLMRSRNLSSGGLGFIHHQPLEPGAVCTVAMQMIGGGGRVLGGRIAWCRQRQNNDGEESPIYELGLQFDQPVDLDDLSTATTDTNGR